MDDEKKKQKAKNSKVETGRTWKDGFLFFIMFGILSKAYFSSFDSMIILNTDDDLNKSIDDSELFETGLIKISYPSDGKNWYDAGIKLLAKLSSCVTVTYENRSNEGTFKAKFNK